MNVINKINTPIISIITSTLNCASALKLTITSITKIKSEFVELIIIDGASSDSTLDVILENKKFIDYWISETDTGIYDAWNKGLKLARGKWIMFLGAGDLIVEESYLKIISSLKRDVDVYENIDFISGKNILYKNNKNIRTIGGPWNWSMLRKYMSIAHPGALHRSSLFTKYGMFDTNFKIAGDYEFLLRIGSKLNALYLTDILVRMEYGGASNSSKVFIENLMAKKKNHINHILFDLAYSLYEICKYIFRKYYDGIVN